jgi:hypothetical protein
MLALGDRYTNDNDQNNDHACYQSNLTDYREARPELLEAAFLLFQRR